MFTTVPEPARCRRVAFLTFLGVVVLFLVQTVRLHVREDHVVHAFVNVAVVLWSQPGQVHNGGEVVAVHIGLVYGRPVLDLSTMTAVNGRHLVLPDTSIKSQVSYIKLIKS